MSPKTPPTATPATPSPPTTSAIVFWVLHDDGAGPSGAGDWLPGGGGGGTAAGTGAASGASTSVTFTAASVCFAATSTFAEKGCFLGAVASMTCDPGSTGKATPTDAGPP